MTSSATRGPYSHNIEIEEMGRGASLFDIVDMSLSST